MTTKQRIEVIEKELQELKSKLETEDNVTAKDFLLEILGNELTIKVDREKYPNSVFYFSSESCLLEFEKSNNGDYLWCNYFKIWNLISERFSLNYASTQSLIKETVEEHFKIRDVTPRRENCGGLQEVEEHFKIRDVTPLNKNI